MDNVQQTYIKFQKELSNLSKEEQKELLTLIIKRNNI